MINYYAIAYDETITPDYYDFSAIERALSRKNVDFDFLGVVNDFFFGNTDAAFKRISDAVINTLFAELIAQKELIVIILTIGIVAAMFSNISGAFLSSGGSKSGFYITYLLLMSALITGYVMTANLVTEAMDYLMELMETMVPTYITALSVCSGVSSANAFYSIFAITISLTQKILRDMLIPLIYVYMIMGLINNLSDGNMLNKACELIKTSIEWILKSVMSFVIGLNVVQSLLSPIVDSLKNNSLYRAAALIPGVGNALSSMSKVIIGSGVLIKNSIGMGCGFAIVALMLSPIIKSIAISFGYKISSAILEPISDKRIVHSINSIYESIILLCKTLLYTTVLFLICFAIMCCTTNQALE